jgi:hypothetical protein
VVRSTSVACMEGYSGLYQQLNASKPRVCCVAGNAQLKYRRGNWLTVEPPCEGQPGLTVVHVPVVWHRKSAVGGLFGACELIVGGRSRSKCD